METFNCNKCKEDKEDSMFSIVCDRVKKDGVKTLRRSKQCKDCVNNYARKYRIENKNRDKDRNNKYKQEWRVKNKERVKETSRIWEAKYRETEKGKESRAKAKKKWYKNNKEKAKKIMINVREKLTDGVVVEAIIKRKNIDRSEVYKYPELIKAKREILKINREIKKQKL